jgi:hypothetical protein
VGCLVVGHHESPDFSEYRHGNETQSRHEKQSRGARLRRCPCPTEPTLTISSGLVAGRSLGPLQSNPRVIHSHNAEAQPLVDPPRRVIYEDAEP